MAQKIVIFHHIRPDGDCLGAQEGLFQIIKANFPEKEVIKVGNPEHALAFMQWQIESRLKDDFSYQLGIIVDANFTDRIEKVEYIKSKKFSKLLRIDHHPNEDDLDLYAKEVIRWVDSTYAAACEQIALMARELQVTLNERATSALYLGILTDSGNFQYPIVASRTLAVASYLLDRGAKKDFLIQNLQKRSLRSLKLQNQIIKNASFIGRVAYYTMSLLEAEKLGYDERSIVRPNHLSNIQNYNVWLSFTEEKNGQIRVEFRSNGPNVSKVAKAFGGGGHLRASGCVIHGNLRNSQKKIEAIVKACNEAVEEWDNE